MKLLLCNFWPGVLDLRCEMANPNPFLITQHFMSSLFLCLIFSAIGCYATYISKSQLEENSGNVALRFLRDIA